MKLDLEPTTREYDDYDEDEMSLVLRNRMHCQDSAAAGRMREKRMHPL